jgi:hypothetical protein
LEAMFLARSVPRLYNEEQLPLWDSLETAVRRVGVWCEMAASPESEKRPLLEDVTLQRSENRDCEHWSMCDSDL